MVVEQFGVEPVVREVPDPVAPPGGVVVAVEATGVCRSDWHAWSGHDPDVVLPHVPGHELAGTVVALGDGVPRRGAGRGDGFAVGDRVTAPFVMACGTCAACRAGQQQVCERQEQPGFTRWGSFAEQVVVERAAVNLVALPEAVSSDVAALLGCRFATAFRAVLAVGRLQAGERVAVHGCGGVGLSAVQIAVAAGARVVAVDVSPGALELARSLGAEADVDAGQVPDAAAAVRELTGGGAHLSLDALGSPATCAGSVRSLRPRGRHVQVGLLPHGDTPVPFDRVVALELELLGSHGMAAHAYPELLALVTAGRLRPDLLVTRTLGLDDAAEALRSVGEQPGIAVVTRF